MPVLFRFVRTIDDSFIGLFQQTEDSMFKIKKTAAIVLMTGILALTACDDGSNGSHGNIISIAEITGLTAPVLGALPVTEITETEQYTGTVSWDGGWIWSPRFAGLKAYTATITLTAKSGYTVSGISENFFTVEGAQSVANPADSGVITVSFPATASAGEIGDIALGGRIIYILQSGDEGYVEGEQRGLIVAMADQGSEIPWALEAYKTTAVPRGTGYKLGDGSANTDKIIAQNGEGTAYAAALARAHDGGGYNDWYLPSQFELSKLGENRHLVGGFTCDYYWSSTEQSNGTKASVLINSANAGVDLSKNINNYYDAYTDSSYPLGVRAFRSF